MPKKHKLSLHEPANYSVIGIACHLREYRMAFLLNGKLHFRFRRLADLVIADGSESRNYAFYMFGHPDDRIDYFLVQNHHPDGKLVPAQKGVDYFMIADESLDRRKVKEITGRIQELPQVLAVFPLDAAKIKNAGILFEEIELQLLEQKNKK
jgi:hypothetical protein